MGNLKASLSVVYLYRVKSFELSNTFVRPTKNNREYKNFDN